MSESVTFTIGGQEYISGPLTIWSLRQVWKDIESLSNPDLHFLEKSGTVTRIVSSGIMLNEEQLPPEIRSIKADDQRLHALVTYFERRMTKDDSDGVAAQFVNLMRISGFLSGEAMAAIQAQTSTEIGTELSPN